ncbi:putative alanine racemase protein [Neofusicoccum parvum UCRNP2]|uniref:D-serine dehydratase n=1 Tax=Botryosphaeria parva (strain UCR-NP2) TaxID=1287680 RepID=R1G6D4_BOTPV|nr:putative alanine racemase protein [Neofusicoccum parvum UCRNP2]
MVDVAQDYLKSFIGRPAIDLPTPALVLSKPVIEKNCQKLHDDVKSLGIGFRPHVKTLKSEEVTRLMLGGVSKGCVASTLREIRGLIPLAKEGLVEDVLYGLPIRPSALPELVTLSQHMKILLMLDHPSQITALEAYAASYAASAAAAPPPWRVFIKIDMGTHRAGIPLTSPTLRALIRAAEASPATQIHGFYCHAGHSYAARTPDAAAAVLRDEVGAAAAAARLLSSTDDDEPLVVSFGSTPTAHVVAALADELPPRLRLELHAGNFPANDLQQLATGCVAETDQAVRVLAEVCSVYAERNEALVNAGVIALAREPGPLPGFGRVMGRPEWNVGRLSQEHGILVSEKEAQGGAGKVEDVFEVGEKVWLWIQHACITAAAHHYYFVVDEEDVVRDVWVPWKGW